MFYGNPYFKPVQQAPIPDVVGAKLTLSGGATLYRRGMFCMYKAASHEEFSPCENGKGLLGYLTQNMDAVGLTMENYAIVQAPDYNLKSGQEASVRRLSVGDEIELEGVGAAAFGNLVVTSSTGAIATNTARYTKLSTIKGGLRIAQAGDIANFELLAADLTPEADPSNVRILVRYVGGQYEVPA